MRRRDFVFGLAGSGLAACGGPQVSLRELVTAEVRLQSLPPGAPPGAKLRSGFLGLSFESAQLVDPAYFDAGDAPQVGLLRRLDASGVLRIGGRSSEFGVWQPQPTALAAPFTHAITPADVDRLARFARASGWRVIYGLNLGHGEPERAADEVAYVAQALGPQLEALQIGNEPDLYYRNGLRPRSYHADAYIAEWRRYARAIRARTPDVPFAGPDVAYRPEWIEAFTQALGTEVKFISDHYDATGPSSDRDLGLPRLFASERTRYPLLRATIMRSAELGRPLRVTEASSVYATGGAPGVGGKPGVSDNMAAALWAAQLLFQASGDGADGLCFQSAPGDAGSPLTRDAKTGAWRARPLYYAMLFFAQAAPARFIAAQVQTANTGLHAHALRDDQGGLKLVLINRSALLPVDARITAERPLLRASALRLDASSLWSTANLLLGGDRVDEAGRWQAQAETVVVDDGAAYVTVSSASAVLLSFA